MLTTMLKSFGTFVITATTSSSITLFFTAIGLILTPISIRIACGLTTSIKVINEVIINNDDNYKKQDEKDQQTNKPFD